MAGDLEYQGSVQSARPVEETRGRQPDEEGAQLKIKVSQCENKTTQVNSRRGFDFFYQGL